MSGCITSSTSRCRPCTGPSFLPSRVEGEYGESLFIVHRPRTSLTNCLRESSHHDGLSSAFQTYTMCPPPAFYHRVRAPSFGTLKVDQAACAALHCARSGHYADIGASASSTCTCILAPSDCSPSAGSGRGRDLHPRADGQAWRQAQDTHLRCSFSQASHSSFITVPGEQYLHSLPFLIFTRAPTSNDDTDRPRFGDPAGYTVSSHPCLQRLL
jgi:hypothetical protein